MSKKKAAKKAAPKKKPTAVHAKPKSKAVKAIKKNAAPRSQVLPGMEQVRNAKLDGICEEISEGRETSNTLATAEKTLKKQAAREMEAKGIPAYRQAGVEIKFAPGEPTLSVRLIKESTTKKRETTTETGSGQDSKEIAEKLTDAEPDEEPF